MKIFSVMSSQATSFLARQVQKGLINQVKTHSFQPSQGADGESEFDDELLEEDELISEAEDVPVRAVAVILASLS